MARTRSVMLCSVCTDEDWLRLSVGAQWMYQALLLQPRLTLIGCLDLRLSRWAQLAVGTDVGPWLDELEQADYVAMDDATEELLIRSFVANDVARSNMNTNTLKGVWSAWQAIESAELRQVAVDNMPPVVWERSVQFTPPAALQMRRSEPMEPPDQTTRSVGSSQPPVGTVRPNHPLPLPTPLPAARRDDPSGDFTLPAETIEQARGGLALVRDRLTSAASDDRPQLSVNGSNGHSNGSNGVKP